MKTARSAFQVVVALAIAALLYGGQDASGTKATERQFKGEIVSIDRSENTLTVKTSVQDAKGEAQEKTVTLPVKEKAEDQIGMLQPGDRVTVLWRTEADGRQFAISVTKAEGEQQ